MGGMDYAKAKLWLDALPLRMTDRVAGFIRISAPATAIRWVAGFGQIERVNIATNQVDATYTTHDRGISFIGVGFGSVWMVFFNTSLVQRLDIAP